MGKNLVLIRLYETEELGWLSEAFQVADIPPEEAEEYLAGHDCDMVLFCAGKPAQCQPYQRLIENIKHHSSCVLLGGDDDVSTQFEAFEYGFDDVLPVTTNPSEALLRLERMLMHRIANNQLQQQLDMASEAAHAAMSDTSDLGQNIQFLLDSADCTTYDELAQRFFGVLRHYGLQASLQLRGIEEIRDFEANGLPKELESRLMAELCDAGRVVNFGKRSVFNYEQVTVLVKNMPVEDEARCGRIRDNLTCLLKGVSTRVKAIDNANELLFERDLMGRVTSRMQKLICSTEETNQNLMKRCADTIEYISAQLEEAIQFLDLTEEQENIILQIVSNGVTQINDEFQVALRTDESFGKLISHIETTLASQDYQRIHALADRL